MADACSKCGAIGTQCNNTCGRKSRGLSIQHNKTKCRCKRKCVSAVLCTSAVSCACRVQSARVMSAVQKSVSAVAARFEDDAAATQYEAMAHSDAASDSDSDVEFGKDKRQHSQAKFRLNGERLPPLLEACARSLAEKYEVIDMQLWRSFLWFVGLMISLQSEILVEPLVLQELREFYVDIDEHFASVLERKYVDRALDMAFRGTSKESATMWRDMYGKAAVAAPQLAAWAVLDACFR